MGMGRSRRDELLTERCIKMNTIVTKPREKVTVLVVKQDYR